MAHRQRHSKIQITKILSKDGKIIAEFKADEKKLLRKKLKRIQRKKLRKLKSKMATKKAGGSSRNGRDSKGRRLGVKKVREPRCLTRKYNSSSARNKSPSGSKCWNWKRSLNFFFN